MATKKLPTAADGIDGLRKFFSQFSDENVLQFICYMKDPKESKTGAGAMRGLAALDAIRAEMRSNATLGFDDATRAVATRLRMRLWNLQRYADEGLAHERKTKGRSVDDDET